jgi:MYXO-CTERM domain-containing protein
MKLRFVFGCAAVLALGSGQAAANGAFPNAGQFIVQPGNPDHLAVRTSFGILMSTDAGATWGLACEKGIGYVDEEPGIAVAGNGTVLASYSEGMASAPIGDGCDWTLGGDVPGVALDVSVQKNDPSIAIALTTSSATGPARLWESTNHGASWDTLGVELPSFFTATTVDVAPSDPQRIYVGGSQGTANPMMAVSIDRGASWDLYPITTDVLDNAPYLAAVDPEDPDLLYVRMAGDPGRLMVSSTGGQTWITGFYGTGPMRGFALSPDGSEVLLGDILGVWHASTATLMFEKQSDTFVQCLAWAEAGVYACSNQYEWGFFLGLSQDEGETFDQVLSMHCIRLFDCDATTTVGDTCPDEWPMLSMQIASHLCEEGGAGGAGGGGPGVGGAGAGGSGSGNGTPAGGSGNGGPDGGGAAGGGSSEGCDCSTPGVSTDPSLWLLFAPLALVARRRRRPLA